MAADDEAARAARAQARRARMTLHKTELTPRESDSSPVYGVRAISLATQLTRECFSLRGDAEPSYSRSDIPIRFVDRAAR